MIKVGFIGRSKILYDTIALIHLSKRYKVEFIITCKDEKYYNFNSKNFKNLSKELSCRFFFLNQLDNKLKLPTADVVLSINYLTIIPYQFINKFKYGILNAHFGDLPKYRGNACPNWAILNNEKNIFLTVHKMDKDLDSGDIVNKYKFPINKNTYIGDFYKWVEKKTPKFFLKSINDVLNNKKLIKQRGKILRTFPRKKEDSKIELNKGILWNYNLIRASSHPFDGTYCFLNNNLSMKIIVWRAEIVKPKYDILAIDGQIIDKNIEKLAFCVSINNEILRITEFSLNSLSQKKSLQKICHSMRNRIT